MSKRPEDRKPPGRPIEQPNTEQEKLLARLSKSHADMLKKADAYEAATEKRAELVLACQEGGIGPAMMGRTLGLSTARMGKIVTSAANRAEEAASKADAA